MPSPIEHLYPVVLAGGSGTRFWPLSRELTPKQMLSVFGGESLLNQAIARVSRFAAPGVSVVLTSERLAGEIRDHLALATADAGVTVLAEPSARNTAAAIALAAAHAEALDPEAIIAVVPSDHLLADGEAWEMTLRTAVGAALEGSVVVLGLMPSSAETGYGYIRRGDAIASAPGAFVVDEFIEKPDPARAEQLVAEGCLWNSGMVVARAGTVLDELMAAGHRAETPDSSHGALIAEVCRRLAGMSVDEWLTPGVRDAYDALPAVQFDRAVLEVSERVAVVPTDLDWSDVGSLLSLERLAGPDERGNVRVGRTVDVDSRDTVIYSPDRLVATLGLDEVMVVDTADATLVAAKDRAQDVRLVVDLLRAQGAPEVTASRTSLRPWGSWTLLLKGDGFQVKTIEVSAGRRLSLQSHRHRSEHWIVVSGQALVERDGEVFELGANESAYLPAESRHRLTNAGEGPLCLIEVAVGGYLGEDDIERYEDDWARRSRESAP